ncbi:MAG: hypothetical protein KF754_15375 [Planctomycetes bacterium]|nr:hypothetical protein [Planctomycetota bacterium]
MSDIREEPTTQVFSHVCNALKALGLAALGAAVMVGMLPLLAGRSAKPVHETSQEPARHVPPQATASR